MAVFLVHPLCCVFFLGRRGVALILFVLIVVPLYFTRKVSMPRWLIISATITGGLVVLLAPAYRTSMAFTGDLRESLTQLETQETVTSYFSWGQLFRIRCVGYPERVCSHCKAF